MPSARWRSSVSSRSPPYWPELSLAPLREARNLRVLRLSFYPDLLGLDLDDAMVRDLRSLGQLHFLSIGSRSAVDTRHLLPRLLALPYEGSPPSWRALGGYHPIQLT